MNYEGGTSEPLGASYREEAGAGSKQPSPETQAPIQKEREAPTAPKTKDWS